MESHREAAVKAACAGITDLYCWKAGAIKLVPIPQMTAVVAVRSERATYARHQFVRIASGGVYKGDTAQVVDVYEGGARLLIRLVPRINLAALALPTAGRTPFGRPARGAPRPPQRLFDRAEIAEASGGSAAVETRTTKWGRAEVFGGATYAGGLLYKEVKAAGVTAAGPAPTMHEMAAFRRGLAAAAKAAAAEEDEDGEGGRSGVLAPEALQSAEDALLESIATSAAAAKREPWTSAAGAGAASTRLVPGDSVIVVRGDLTNLTGTVATLHASAGTFSLTPSAESAAALGFSDRLEIGIDEVVKVFEVGAHVKVLGGAYVGETGTVLAVRPPAAAAATGDTSGPESSLLAVLLLDSGNRTVEAFVRFLTRSSEVVTSLTDVDGYELGDLVEVPGVADATPTAGVIVALGGAGRTVSVLSVTGAVRELSVAQLRGKLQTGGRKDDRSVAVDRAGAPISVGDVVSVDLGDLKGACEREAAHLSALYFESACLCPPCVRVCVCLPLPRVWGCVAECRMHMMTIKVLSADWLTATIHLFCLMHA